MGDGHKRNAPAACAEEDEAKETGSSFRRDGAPTIGGVFQSPCRRRHLAPGLCLHVTLSLLSTSPCAFCLCHLEPGRPKPPVQHEAAEGTPPEMD